MKCPLSFNKGEGYQVDCYREECAWWNDDANACAILQLSRDIYKMEDIVALHLRK